MTLPTYTTTSSLRGHLGPDWQTPAQINADLDAQLEAERQASRSAAAGVFAWSEMDAGRTDFSNAKTGQTFGQGCDLTRWMFHAKRYSTVDGWSFKDAEWQRGNGAGLTYENTDFSGADLTGTAFRGATFHNCTFSAGTRFDGADLKEARFTGSSPLTAKLASFKDAEFGHFVFERASDRQNTIGLPDVPPGAKLINDEPKRPQYGADIYASD